MPLLLLLFLLTKLAAAPPSISNITLDNITHAGARLSWTTEVNATTCLDWGSTVAYGLSSCSATLNAVKNHAWHIGGAAPAAVLHVRIRSKTA